MSEEFERSRGDARGTPPARDPGPTPDSGVLPATGAKELLKRLDEHRARGPRHVIAGTIGVGGMGEILKVSDQDLGRDLAMKVLRRDCAQLGEAERTRMLARFLEEAQITGQLHHPSIVPVHELSIGADGQPYFTMPLIRGWDFGEIIKFVREGKDGWTLARALAIVLRVCEAVAYAHARGVIHRDIKPSNVRVGRFGETYLMDWGLARVLGRTDTHDLRMREQVDQPSADVRTERSKQKQATPDSPLITMDGEVVGTPHYMSPEQSHGETESIGPHSDVYSLGALLYHLLAGRAPYAPPEGALSPRAVWSLVLDGPPKDLRELAPEAPEDLVDICKKAMHRDPAGRYRDAQALAHDIEAYLDRRPVQAHAPSVIYALRLSYERNRPLIIVAFAAVAVVLGISVLQWAHVRDVKEAEQLARQISNDSGFASALQAEARELRTATPRELARFDPWLQAADELVLRTTEYEKRLQAQPAGAPVRQALASHLGQVTALRAVTLDVRHRRQAIADLERKSLVDSAEPWKRCTEDTRASGKFGERGLAPLIGLAPLWKNRFGLWEFWHVDSGKRPAADSAESYAPDPDDGIVLVLVPGGSFEMGSPESERGRAAAVESLRATTVRPFFIARFEVTQAQWLRVMGENPSRYRPENTLPGHFTLLHPVESVTWDQAQEFSKRLELRLPTEAEWEYACRSGSRTAYYWGDDWEGLEGHENVLDDSAGENAGPARAKWEDGFVRHGPIGQFEPNDFGLHDMLGNVSEWCADLYHAAPPGAARDDEESPGIQMRVVRGGCWYFPPVSGPLEYNRAAFRQADNERALTPARGVRVARDCADPAR